MVTHGGSVRPNSISCRDAIRELHQRVKAAVPYADPAPWLDVSPDLIEMFSQGDEAAFVRREKMQERSELVLRRGLLSGALRAHFSDGLESRDVPGWAWAAAERIKHVWPEGRLPLDVFLPDEWQRWSRHSVYLDRDAFTTWMDSQALHDPSDLPALPPPYDAHSEPEPVKKRLPPDAAFVTLSEALTWIAFGFSMASAQLHEVLSLNHFGERDPQEAIKSAMARLVELGRGERIAMQGKYCSSHREDKLTLLTAAIEPIKYADFRQFDCLGDELRHGEGLTRWNTAQGVTDRLHDGGRHDSFIQVSVNRVDLLREFPPREPASAMTITSAVGAEKQCRDWLAEEFANEPDKRTKADFQTAALERFPGHLSARGFIRAWAGVAPDAGRSKPGRKS